MSRRDFYNLYQFDKWFHKAVAFPSPYHELDNTAFICLRDADLQEIPENIGKLDGARGLTLSNNQIAQIDPNLIHRLPELCYLYLSYNRISEFPVDFDRLPGLEYLCLRNNRLRQIPGGLLRAYNLKYINFRYNQISYGSDEKRKWIAEFLKLMLPQLRYAFL